MSLKFSDYNVDALPDLKEGQGWRDPEFQVLYREWIKRADVVISKFTMMLWKVWAF